MADDVSRLVEDITERVRQALQSLRAGVDAPRATAAAAAAGLARDDGAPVAAGCRCCSLEGCGAAVVLREGLGPVGAERLRSGADFAPLIDHTLLKPDASRDEVLTLCEEAVKYGFASVCVNAANVALAAHALRGSTTIPIAVVGFPLGATTPAAKAFEAREAVRCGAREVDMVQNLGALKSKDYALVLQDVVAVVRAAEPWPVKVILETSQLTQDEKSSRAHWRRRVGRPS